MEIKVINSIGYVDRTLRTTEHIRNHSQRILSYSELLSNTFIQCFLVDKGHINGLEIHCINVHGLIYIYNYSSKKFITILHPRPSQLKRYYRLMNKDIPLIIRRLAVECHKRNEQYDLNYK